MNGRVATPVWDAAPVRRGLEDRVGRSAWVWPSLEERRSFVVRVVGLVSGWVRVRAGGISSPEKLEELEGSSCEAGMASWPEPEPKSVIAKRGARGEHGCSAMPNGQDNLRVSRTPFDQAASCLCAVAHGSITCRCRQTQAKAGMR